MSVPSVRHLELASEEMMRRVSEGQKTICCFLIRLLVVDVEG